MFIQAGKYLESLQQKPSVFWIDTLCVPVGDDITLPSVKGRNTGVVKSRELRKAAIRRMAEIYRNADRVLVLDAGLVGRVFNRLEKLMRVATCSWLRRLWTLQEACLAGSSLFFQFEDSAVPVMDLISPTPKYVDRHDLSNWCEGAGAQSLAPLVATGQVLKANPGSSVGTVDRQEAFERLLGLLSLRSTSKCEDEALCLAMILGMDVAQIYDIKGAPRRMRKIFEAIGEMDPQVLFTSGPRLKEEGFRWAPESFLSRPNGHDTLVSGGDQISKEVVATQRAQDEETPGGETPGGDTWPVACYRPGEEEPYGLFVLTECTKSTLDEDNGKLPDIGLLPDVELAVLWLNPSDAFSAIAKSQMGVLVWIDGEVEGGEALLVHYLCRVEGTRADGRSDVDNYDEWYEGLELGVTGCAITSQGARMWRLGLERHNTL
ncbi:hypothetical protein ABVK25_010689 [Lepraria finkii]|uniref:Heterokaryon incompatibility domain-containing protein n=1 Tax=Lepraria finkii TaxID=1340010 RepID=A0ABR4ATJ3_9LECA